MYLSGALDIRSAFVASLGDRMYLSGALDVRTAFVASLDDCMSSNHKKTSKSILSQGLRTHTYEFLVHIFPLIYIFYNYLLVRLDIPLAPPSPTGSKCIYALASNASRVGFHITGWLGPGRAAIEISSGLAETVEEER